MQRDPDLIRALLLFFENRVEHSLVEVPRIEGYEDETILYHLVLMYQAGFLACEPIRSSTSDRIIKVIPFDLTWDGHEFLDKIRSETVWRRILGTIKGKGGSLAFAVINRMATDFAVQQVTGST
jgi:hypothetical protein